MRKTFGLFVSMALMFFAMCSVSLIGRGFNASFTETNAASLSDNAVITMSGENNEKEIVVTASLRKNTGLNGMTTEISYDTSAMTLTNVERGKALSTLEYMTTNVETEKGYAITPFIINWSGDKNDDSIGLLITMHFVVKEGAVDGEYQVILKSERNTVTYVDEGVKTKSVLIDGVKVLIKGNAVEKIVDEAEEKEDTKIKTIILITSISGGVFVLGGAATFIIIKLKGKKTWTKIK